MSTRISALVLALAGLAAAGCGGEKLAVDGSTTVGSDAPPPATTTATQPETTATPTEPTETEPAGPSTALRVYLAQGEHVAAVAREVPKTEAVARAALRALLDGPSPEERSHGFSTAVPGATALRGLAVADGVATVDLSSSYASGGGSLSETMRLAQVVYTLTQFPTVRSVRFELDGEPVTAFSGEGIDISAPQTRANYESVTPRILVESPTPGASVRCPLRITGTSNNFEATFIAELWVGGHKVGGWPVMATSGTGTRGTFDATLCQGDFSTGHDAASLVVYEPSAENGEPLGKIEIPLQHG